MILTNDFLDWAAGKLEDDRGMARSSTAISQKSQRFASSGESGKQKGADRLIVGEGRSVFSF
jgi:hypothetical protein